MRAPHARRIAPAILSKGREINAAPIAKAAKLIFGIRQSTIRRLLAAR